MKYDPNKVYTWAQDEKFELTGREFGLILNTLRAVLNTEQANTILMANTANRVIENIMADMVEKGIIKEVPQENNKDNG